MEHVGEQWAATAETVLTGMHEWRAQHATATFAEIEAELDERLAGLRARMLQDLALASRARRVGVVGQEPVACARCGGKLAGQGTHARTLTTQHNRAVQLDREYARCAACGAAFFPPR